LGDKR